MTTSLNHKLGLRTKHKGPSTKTQLVSILEASSMFWTFMSATASRPNGFVAILTKLVLALYLRGKRTSVSVLWFITCHLRVAADDSVASLKATSVCV